MFSDSRKELLQNLYVANVKNRLRELESPSIDLQKRWIWELIQNAKDCCKESISFIPNSQQILRTANKPVDIKIIFDKFNRKVIFKHNGFPFIGKTLDSLMYKNSTKDTEEDNTGRFGTGFMTSHTLSRVVKIQAPFIHETQNNLTLQYIEATVYREGRTDKQLRQEFDKMEQSKKFYVYDQRNANHKWTIFTYELTNELGMSSAELGIQSFRENIVKVFLFCNEINSIQINEEKPLLFSECLCRKMDNLIDTRRFTSSPFNCNSSVNEKTIDQRKFIVATFDEMSDEYSKKFANDHEIEYKLKSFQFSIAFEINSNNQIIDHNTNEVCLFCTFPLIGSEQTQLPYLLNCPQFETLTERNGLIMEGPNYDSNKILTNTGLNCMIIDHSIQKFSNLLLQMSNYSHFSSFSNGLANIANKIPKMRTFYEKLRSELETKYIVFRSINAKLMLKETVFLDFNNIVDKEGFYRLASIIYSNLASFEESIQWNNKTWPALSVLNLSTFLNHISSIVVGEQFYYNGIFNYRLSNSILRNKRSPLNVIDINFLNKLYYFILKENKFQSLILNFKIILNVNSKFTYFNSIKDNRNLSNDFNKIMSMCDDWNDIIINPKITALSPTFFKKVTVNDAIYKMNDFISIHNDDINVLLSFTQYILKDNEFRIKMYKVAQYFYPEIGPINYVTNVDPRIWDQSDKAVLQHIFNLISKKEGSVIAESSLDIYNSFYSLYQQKYINKFDVDFLIPNVDLVLKHRYKLTGISSSLKEVFKVVKPLFKWDNIVNPLITSVDFYNQINFKCIIQTINSDSFYYNDKKLILYHFLAVIGILPSKDNQRLFDYQNNILLLTKFFFGREISPIETNISDESFWKRANEIVLSRVDLILNKYPDIKGLKTFLQKDEKTIFDHLNIYYNLIASSNSKELKKILVPTIKGQFLSSELVSFSKGVSNELFDLYNMINPGTDIKDKIAHPEIKCSFLNVIDFQKFLLSISANLSDDKLIHDSKIVEAIRNLKLFQVNNSLNQNDLLLEKLYIANIKNRLNEIQNPNESDKARWPWELIQNAKDSLYSPSNNSGQKRVTIFINVNNQNNEVVFSHNGPPFTENSYFGLLYKISQEKDNSKTTGRFGTGFVSTHVLSKVVEINGNKIDKNGKIFGFSVIIHREGLNDSSISHDFKEMQKSLQVHQQLMPYTSFKYNINSDKSRECLKLGLENFKNNISFVLINCFEIKFIVLKENNKSIKYHATRKFIKKINNYSYYTYSIFTDNYAFQNYIVLIDEVDQISISLQISKLGEIIHADSESLFTIFPLVGSKAHMLPFLINSPNFEPVTERNALHLGGDSRINGEMTNTGKNKVLLMKSIDLFKSLIQILNENKCPNMYELSRGLLLSQSPYSSFDMDWYKKSFLKNMRDIMANNVTVQSISDKRILLRDAFFPSKKIFDFNLHEFLNLSKKYYKNMVDEKEANIWKDKIWESLNICSVKKLIESVINDKSIINREKILYLNDLLDFIWKYDKNLLYEYTLIPDMNMNLHCLSKRNGENNDFKECKSVPYCIIQMMESIEIPWKSTHMNNAITSINLSEDKIIDAESRISEQINNHDYLSLQLMRFVLEKNDFRQKMYEFVYELKFMPFKKIIVIDLNPKIWEQADKYVMQIVAKRISSFRPSKVQKSMQLIMKFLRFLSNNYCFRDIYWSSEIFPNANYSLKSIKNLKNKSKHFHDYLNPIMVKYFNKDFNDIILHPQINQFIHSKDNEHLSEYIEIMNEKIDNFCDNDKIMILEHIISLVPKDEKKKEQISKQDIVFQLHHDLINPKIIKVSIPESLYQEDLWRKINSIIISNICSKIQETKSLSNFQKEFSIDNESKCFDILNSIYQIDCEISSKYKIIPNKCGIFMSNKDLFEDPKIGNDLFESLSILNPQNNYHYEMADQRIKNSRLKKFNVPEFYQRLSQIFFEAIKNKNDKLFEVINKISHIDDPLFFDSITSNKKNQEEKARNDILLEAHISFIKNRLRELNSPDKKDFQRWPFELIQNANDSVLSSENGTINKKVKIEFDFQKNKVIFKHDGSPFKYKSLMALLYQCSNGKEDNRTTGRFGTGFMSTCILSRIVHISGDVKTNFTDREEISGFEVTIYREGDKKKDLKIGVDNMTKSLKKNCPVKGVTTFEYNLDPNSKYYENSLESYHKGLTSLKNNISPVLILNPTIDSITIKSENEVTIYKANHENDPIHSVTIKKNNQTIKTTKYLLFSSSKIFQSKNVHVDCLLQIGPNNIIFNQNDKDTLFISYPLFCANQFYSPIIINSQKFEPTKERDDIIIQSEEIESESYDSLINKFILKESINIFGEMIKYIVANSFSDLYNLCIGLKKEYDDKQSFKKKFIEEMRFLILNSSVFETEFGLKNSNEIIIPYIKDFDDFDPRISYKEFYDLLSQIDFQTKFIVTLKVSSQLQSLLWKDFPSKFGIENLFEFISKSNKLIEFPLINNDYNHQIKFIKDLLSLVEKMKKCNKIFDENNLLINGKGEFVSKGSIFFFDLPSVFIDMLNIVSFDFDAFQLHQEIQYLYKNKRIKFKKFEIIDAINGIMEKITEESSIKFMRYVIENDAKREFMFQYSQKLGLLNNCGSEEKISIDVSSFDDKSKEKLHDMFHKIDSIVIKQMINKIEMLNIMKNINFLIEFIKLLKSNLSSDEFDKLKIFPNQEYQLCTSEALVKDEIQDENIKNIIQTVFDINLRQELILDPFKELVKLEEKNLMKLSRFLLKRDGFEESVSSSPQKKQFYTIIFQYSSLEKEQEPILDLLSFFYKVQINKENQENLNENNCWLNGLTKTVINIVIEEIINKISQCSNVKELVNTDGDEELIYQNLSNLYSFSLKRNIFPNMYGQLKTLDDISFLYDNLISKEDLNAILGFLREFQNSDDINHSILNQHIQIPDHIINRFHLYDLTFLSDKITKIILEKEENKEEIDQELLKRFYSFLEKDKKIKIAFSDLIDKKLAEIRLGLLADIASLNDDYEQDSAEIGYTGEALIYEALLKNEKFSKVIWKAKSNCITKCQITLKNGNTYFINEVNEPYDIYAEDNDGNIFYFEVKSKKSFGEKQKSVINLSRNQISFANQRQKEKENFVLAFALNVLDEEPILMFLKQSNNEFINETFQHSEIQNDEYENLNIIPNIL